MTELPRGAKGSGWLLPVVLSALAMVVAAVPAMNIALPDLARDTGATQSDMQWVVDAYALIFAGLLLPAGALGDRYGRKPVLVTGLGVFATAAAAGALCTSPEPLIAARAVMGVGAALIMPTTLSIITTSFPPGERPRAIGTWIGVAGAGAILGLLASGTLLEWWGWQSVFWLNVALGGAVGLAAFVKVPNSVDDSRPAVDYVGGALITVSLAGLVFGAIEGPEHGWASGPTLGSFALSAVAGAAWFGWGLTAREPLLDPRLFTRGLFSTGVVSIAAQFFVFFGYIFLVIQYVQLVLGYSPLQAGLALLPMGLVLGGISRNAPRVASHLSRRTMSAGGLVAMAVGMAILSRLTQDSSYWLLLVGILPVGAGMALATAPATAAIVAALPANKQGVASAVNDASREVGGTLGIAVLGSVLNAAYRSGLAHAVLPGTPAQAHHAAQSLPAALTIAQGLGPAGAAVAQAAKHSFVHGMTEAFTVSSAIMMTLAVGLALSSRPAAGGPGPADAADVGDFPAAPVPGAREPVGVPRRTSRHVPGD